MVEEGFVWIAVGDLTVGTSAPGDWDFVSEGAFLVFLLCRLVRRVPSSLDCVGETGWLCFARSKSAGRWGEARGASSLVKFLSLLFLLGPPAGGIIYRTVSRAPLGEKGG